MKEEKQKEANHEFHFISFSLYLFKMSLEAASWRGKQIKKTPNY